MNAIKDILATMAGLVMVVVLWAVGCMFAVLPIMVGLWLWRAIL